MSFATCFLGKGKDFVLASGGYGIARRVKSDCEIFNAIDGYWTLFPNMNIPRASHSILLSDNLKWVYCFGGLTEGNEPTTSIERIRINNAIDPTKDINSSWEILSLELK